MGRPPAQGADYRAVSNPPASDSQPLRPATAPLPLVDTDSPEDCAALGRLLDDRETSALAHRLLAALRR